MGLLYSGEAGQITLGRSSSSFSPKMARNGWHRLTGDRKGNWSLLVTKNWRMTFRVGADEIEIIDLDYEDYY